MENDLQDKKAYDEIIASTERGLIKWALEKTAGNIMQAAKLLEINRTRFYFRMKRHGILAQDYKGKVFIAS